MAVPDFLGFARLAATQKSPLMSAIQGGLQTYGTISQLQMNRVLRKEKQLELKEMPQKLQLAQQLAQAQITAEQSIPGLRGAQAGAARASAARSMAGAALERARMQQVQEGGGLAALRGVAANAASLDEYLKQHPASTPEGHRALEAWNAQVGGQQARALYYKSNLWLKNLPKIQKAQFYNDFQQENTERQDKGLPTVTANQYAQGRSIIPTDQQTQAVIVDSHVRQIQGQQAQNGLPIQHASQIIDHLAQGHQASTIAQQQTGQPIITASASAGGISQAAVPIVPQITQATTAQSPLAKQLMAGQTVTLSTPQDVAIAKSMSQAPTEIRPGQAVKFTGGLVLPVGHGEGMIPPGISIPSAIGAPGEAAPIAAAQMPAPTAPQAPQAPVSQIAPAPAIAGQAPSGLITQPDYSRQLAQTRLGLLKETSDQQNRNKLLYGTQAERTIGNMKGGVNSMVYYTGPKGAARLAADQAKAAAGITTPQYENYQKFVTNAGILGPQLLQYYGLGIQKDQRQEIDLLTNPRNWHDNPRVTRAKFDAFVKTLNQEISIRRKALKDPSLYYDGEKKTPVKYTEADYAETAAKHGVSVAEVKAFLNKRGG